jgi:acetylornithine deacetylase/succinyl-diaminopimelate desuccinylase-like protein
LISDPGVAVEVIDWPDTRPVTAPWDGGLFDALQQACQTYQPKAIVTPSICVGGTDARHFRERGVPSYGLVPGMFTADDLKGYHGLNERISVDNLLLGTQIVYDATRRVAAA